MPFANLTFTLASDGKACKECTVRPRVKGFGIECY